jgi:hypothetical protein
MGVAGEQADENSGRVIRLACPASIQAGDDERQQRSRVSKLRFCGSAADFTGAVADAALKSCYSWPHSRGGRTAAEQARANRHRPDFSMVSRGQRRRRPGVRSGARALGVRAGREASAMAGGARSWMRSTLFRGSRREGEIKREYRTAKKDRFRRCGSGVVQQGEGTTGARLAAVGEAPSAHSIDIRRRSEGLRPRGALQHRRGTAGFVSQLAPLVDRWAT